MKDKIFIDSNILIYAHTDMDIEKQIKAQQLLLSDSIFISTKVINEFINVCRKKFKKDWKEINKVLKEITGYSTIQLIGQPTIEKAIEIAIHYKYSYYDSLIIASAVAADCLILYSEDLQDQQKIYKTLTIINPLK